MDSTVLNRESQIGLKCSNNDGKRSVRLPPLLCMTLNSPVPKSEYGASFSSKQRLVHPGMKLAPSFMFRSSRDLVGRRARATRLPGFVPTSNSGAASNYNFVHSGAFYGFLGTKKQYFTLGHDWVSEKPVRKNNPFS